MRRGTLVLIAALLVASACARRHSAVSTTPQPGDSVVVNVVNHFGPMIIFVRGSGQDFRMGTVDAASTGRFVLRFGWIWGRGVEFVAAPQGGWAPTAYSGYLTLRPGDVVTWDMQSRPTLQP